MPIPQPKQQRILGGAIALCRTEASFDEALAFAREGVLAMLTLGEQSPAKDGIKAEFRLNSALPAEQYSIRADEHGVLVEAGDIAGAVYAACTLSQLCAEHGGNLPYCTIEDAPEHPWRGLLIDVCRHFFPIAVLETRSKRRLPHERT